jgi:hypothetical protein
VKYVFLCWVVNHIKAYATKLSFIGIYFILDLLHIFMWTILSFGEGFYEMHLSL